MPPMSVRSAASVAMRSSARACGEPGPNAASTAFSCSKMLAATQYTRSACAAGKAGVLLADEDDIASAPPPPPPPPPPPFARTRSETWLGRAR